MTPVGGGVLAAPGFRAATGRAGMRHAPGDDVALLLADAPASAAATFTTSRFPAAPVLLAGERLVGAAPIRGIVVNAGCANAGTGAAGLADAARVTAAAAMQVGCGPEEVLPASTGLIGTRLDVPGIELALAGMRPRRGLASATAAARAIMTTDTRPKQAAVRCQLPGGGRLTVGGMAKGSGMIHPTMATMLAFLTTDADVGPDRLRDLLRPAVDETFNQLSVDGDGSTNDAVFLLASRRVPIDRRGETLLAAAIHAVCRSLAQQIAADGEGATRRIDVRVDGATDTAQARRAARAVAASSLVKAAVHGGDPNWGRIGAAVGRAGVDLDATRMQIRIGDALLYAGTALDAPDIAAARRELRRRVVRLRVDLGVGAATGEAWGCDLSADYVAINSEYAT